MWLTLGKLAFKTGAEIYKNKKESSSIRE